MRIHTNKQRTKQQERDKSKPQGGQTSLKQALGTQALPVLKYGIDYRAILEIGTLALYFLKWKSLQKESINECRF